MKAYIFLILVMMLALNHAYADDDSHRFPMDLHDLKLSPQQHKAVESAMKEYQHDYRRFHRQNESIEEESNALLLDPIFDEKTFRTKNMEIARASIEIRIRLFSRLHTILTPEQKRRFIRHIEEWDIE